MRGRGVCAQGVAYRQRGHRPSRGDSQSTPADLLGDLSHLGVKPALAVLVVDNVELVACGKVRPPGASAGLAPRHELLPRLGTLLHLNSRRPVLPAPYTELWVHKDCAEGRVSPHRGAARPSVSLAAPYSSWSRSRHRKSPQTRQESVLGRMSAKDAVLAEEAAHAPKGGPPRRSGAGIRENPGSDGASRRAGTMSQPKAGVKGALHWSRPRTIHFLLNIDHMERTSNIDMLADRLARWVAAGNSVVGGVSREPRACRQLATRRQLIARLPSRSRRGPGTAAPRGGRGVGRGSSRRRSTSTPGGRWLA